MRLSQRQMDMLLALDGTNEPDTVCMYIEHLPRQHSFNSERERERFLDNLERRGLISINRKCFIRLTDAGAAVVRSKPANVGAKRAAEGGPLERPVRAMVPKREG